MGDGSNTTRVAVVDDHPIVRAGLTSLLESLPGIEVVGEACDGAEAVRLAVTVNPDVLVMDLDMPGMDGIEATRQVSRSAPNVGVLVLTMFEDHERVQQALRAGARGYLVKGSPQREIALAISAVADRGAYFGASVVPTVLGQLGTQTEAVMPFPELTARELEVLVLIADGISNAVIASRLALSPKTVANHISSIFAKLGVVTRAEAIVAAHRRGIG